MDVDVVDKNAATGGGDGSVEGKSLARGEFLDDIPDALTQTELIQRRREKISTTSPLNQVNLHSISTNLTKSSLNLN